MPPAPSSPPPIDGLMERASTALVETRYFECERLCVRAIESAREIGDYERLSRAVLPLQEARRQKRQAAFDAGVLGAFDRPGTRRATRPGCALFTSPLTPAHARAWRLAADESEICVVALACEECGREGPWRVAAHSDLVSIRADVAPPPGEALTVRWFAAAAEALSAAGLQAAPPPDQLVQRIENLLRMLDAHPYDEAMHQALAAACQACLGTG